MTGAGGQGASHTAKPEDAGGEEVRVGWDKEDPSRARGTRSSRVNPAVTVRMCRRKFCASYGREPKAAVPVDRKIG